MGGLIKAHRILVVEPEWRDVFEGMSLDEFMKL
jgi:hypothetical protein